MADSVHPSDTMAESIEEHELGEPVFPGCVSWWACGDQELWCLSEFQYPPGLRDEG